MRKMFIVGSDAFLVTSMRLALRYASGVSVLGVLEDGEGVAEAIREATPDIVVIDAAGDPERALDRMREAREERPEALIVVIAAELDDDLFEETAQHGALVCLGTAGLVPQLQALLAEPRRPDGSGQIALAAVNGRRPAEVVERPSLVEPDCPLTQRELEILRAVAQGHGNARIGRDLWISEQTVKFHLSKIYRKLEVANRTEASRYVLMHDLVESRRRARRLPTQRGYGSASGAYGTGQRAASRA
jgi:DNA-binding NarL/FixJ family response regulator